MIALAFLINLIKLNEDKRAQLNRIVNTFIGILIVTNIFSAARNAIIQGQHDAQLSAIDTHKALTKPKRDIVWILLDEYTSPASLKSQFGRNNPLVDSLNNKSFYVFNSLPSRYAFTLYSVNSIFNLDDPTEPQNVSSAAHYLNQSKWVEKLRFNGYNFINLDFLDIANVKKVYIIELFADNYLRHLLSDSPVWEAINTKKGPAPNWDAYNQFIIGKLTKQIAVKQTAPTFIWAHLLIPHPPFFRDAKGNLNKNPIALDDNAIADTVGVKIQYVNYLYYANTVVLKMLKQIPNWQKKIIVISGDHGARMLIPDNDPRKKTTFAAVYDPDIDAKDFQKIKYLQQLPLLISR